MQNDEIHTGAVVHRRTVVKGAAWAVPVIAMAVAAPVSAASGPCEARFKPAVTWSRPRPADGSSFTLGGIKAWPDGTSFHSYDTKDVVVTATVTNVGEETVPAGGTVLDLLGVSFPGDENDLSVTPFNRLTLPSPLPVGWQLVDTTAPFAADNSEEPGSPATTGIYSGYSLRYTLELAPGASATPVPLTFRATTPRPEPEDYPRSTKVFTPGLAGRNYGQLAWADVTFAGCTEATVTATTETFGVELQNPYYPGP